MWQLADMRRSLNRHELLDSSSMKKGGGVLHEQERAITVPHHAKTWNQSGRDGYLRI